MDHDFNQDDLMKSGTKISSPLRSAESGRGGFTLVELMVAMALGLIVLGAMYSVFTIQNKHFSNQEQIVEMQQNARMAIDIISREIRMAGYNPRKTTNLFTFKIADSYDRKTDHHSVAFTSDYSGGGGENYDDNEQIAFRVEGGVLQRFSTGSVHWQPLMENIDVLEFTYTLNDGTVVAPPSDPTAAQVLTIAKVKIKVTAKAAKADPGYTDPTNNDHYRRYTLTASVTPRNL
jgi:type IV pilus assembly protein PilW